MSRRALAISASIPEEEDHQLDAHRIQAHSTSPPLGLNNSPALKAKELKKGGVVAFAESTLQRSNSAEDTDGSPSPGIHSDSAPSRRSSIVSFHGPSNPALPQGRQRKTNSQRIREASPIAVRFRHHVSFDNIPVGEATKNNTLGYTLNLTHDGYHPKRRSRTMMAGVDQHSYSDYALQWLLEEYAEDGDEVICVHVSERDSKDDKNYKAKAEAMVQRIKQKIPPDCAISIKLEYAVGKLHETFQKLIHVYQPSMLVVGTRGRSLGGIQGLVNTRNSFSKYCLQYSPVPTVVVRDIDKRQKKKEKRTHDPSRQSYISMLAANQGKHEADSENSSLYEMEAKLSADEEAHRVAAAIGLPASFDPTLIPIDPEALMHPRSQSVPALPHTESSSQPDSLSGSRVIAVPPPPSTLGGSDDDDSSGDEFETEQVVAKGSQTDPTDQKIKKARLHQMEVNEAAALLNHPHNDDEDSDDDSDGNGDADRGPRGVNDGVDDDDDGDEEDDGRSQADEGHKSAQGKG